MSCKDFEEENSEKIEELINDKSRMGITPEISATKNNEKGSAEDLKALWIDIGAVQAELKPFIPEGEMPIGGKKVPYITKPQIISKLSELLSKHKLICSFEGIRRIDVVKEYIVFWNDKAGVQKRPNIHLRYWVEYAIRNLEGAAIFRIIPGDVMGYDSKHSTIAMAFALRDFLSQMFLVSADPDTISLEELQEYGAEEVARKLSMDDILVGLQKKALFLIQKVGIAPLQKRAKVVAFKPKSWKLEDMNPEDLWKLIEIGMEIISPSTEKESLQAVINKKEK